MSENGLLWGLLLLVGVGGAMWLHEYSRHCRWIEHFMRTRTEKEMVPKFIPPTTYVYSDLADQVREQGKRGGTGVIKYTVTIDETIAYLNDLARLDPKAMRLWVLSVVPCNEGLAHHPTVQVGITEGKTYEVGPLGVLNGLFGADEDGWGEIVAIVSEKSVFFRRATKLDKISAARKNDE